MFPNGIITSMVTNFDKNGDIDLQGLAENIMFQKKAGIRNVCILGGTGEALSLSQEERHQIMEASMIHSAGMNVVFGTLAGKPTDIIQDIQKAKVLGADACMVMAPPFYRPSESDVEELIKEYASIGMPLILFNTPSRSGFNMSFPLIFKLSKIKEVIAIKESSGDMLLLEKIKNDNKDRISILTGGDTNYFTSMVLGANGGLIATAAVIPEVILELESAINQGDLVLAREIHYLIKLLAEVMYKASHPFPLKIAMKQRGLPAGNCRLPFKNIDKNHEEQIYIVMKTIKSKLEDKVKFIFDYNF